MAKTAQQRYRDYWTRTKLKTRLLSDLDRARREDLAEQFEKTTGDPYLIAKLREYFMRHPMCFTAPKTVNAFGQGRVTVVFDLLDRDAEPAAVYSCLLDPVNVTVHSRMTTGNLAHAPIRSGTLKSIRDKQRELEDAGLWGDDPL